MRKLKLEPLPVIRSELKEDVTIGNGTFKAGTSVLVVREAVS